MRYYVRRDKQAEVLGPFSVQELIAAIETGDLSADSLASSDLGETSGRLRKFRHSDWFLLSEIPDLRRLVPPALKISTRTQSQPEASQPLTAKGLIITWTGMTVGVALLLPGIFILNLLGYLVLTVSSALAKAEQPALREVQAVFFFLAISMISVAHAAFSGWDLLSPMDGMPGWYVVFLLSLWAVGMTMEYRRWKSYDAILAKG